MASRKTVHVRYSAPNRSSGSADRSDNCLPNGKSKRVLTLSLKKTRNNSVRDDYGNSTCSPRDLHRGMLYKGTCIPKTSHFRTAASLGGALPDTSMDSAISTLIYTPREANDASLSEKELGSIDVIKSPLNHFHLPQREMSETHGYSESVNSNPGTTIPVDNNHNIIDTEIICGEDLENCSMVTKDCHKIYNESCNSETLQCLHSSESDSKNVLSRNHMKQSGKNECLRHKVIVHRRRMLSESALHRKDVMKGDAFVLGGNTLRRHIALRSVIVKEP